MIVPIKTLKVDTLTIHVYNSRQDMGIAAYELYKKHVRELMARQKIVRAIFAAAHSQDDFLKALAEDTEIDFTRITGFHMDEYMGLGKDASQNFGNFLRKAIFSRKPFHEVNYIQSDAIDISAECKRYEGLLRQAPLDIVSMGIGENGHIAFNDPHEARFDEEAWIRQTSLDNVCRQQQVNDGEFGTLSDVPETALTLTIPALMSCRKVICIVPTGRKAQAVRQTLCGPVSVACPASVLRTHSDATLFLDKEAAELILTI